MSSSEAPIDPLSPIDHLLHWLTATSIHVVIGLLLGSLATGLMRRRALHWSWAALALPAVILLRDVLGGCALPLATASLLAARRGRCRHHEDLESGADLAAEAAKRRSPRDALRRLVVAWSHRREPVHERAWRGERLLVGHDQGRRSVWIPLGGSRGGTHTLVLGATGSGKTVTMSWIAARAIERGMGAVVIDPKGDPSLRGLLRASALAERRRFIEWTPAGPSVYNPYAGGSDSEIADKALSGERFTEPHYLRQAQRYLGHEVRALRGAGLTVSLRTLAKHLEPSELELLLQSLPEDEAADSHAYLDSLTERQRRDLTGVRDRLAILAESDVGPWLDPLASAERRFDLCEAVRERAVVYFALESDRRPLLAQMLAAAIVGDLQSTVASLQDRPVPCLAVIDEFSAVVPEQVSRLFGRARSAGMSLLVGTQELADLRPPGHGRLLEQILGNISVLIAHRQVLPDSAELISSLAGTRGAWSATRHSSGSHTHRRVRERLLHPDAIKGLDSGCAAVLVLSGGLSVRIARILRAAAPTRS